MNFAPYQWRADHGYLPPPGSMLQPLHPSPAYWAYPTPQFPQPQCVSAPLYVNGVVPSYYPGPVMAIPPPPRAAPPSVASTPAPTPPGQIVKKNEAKRKAESKPKMDSSITKLPSVAPGESSSGKEDSKTVAFNTNCHVPPSLRPGMNYMFPREHTMLHIFNKASKIWEDKYKGQALAFKTFKVSTAFTVQTVIERVMRGDADKCKGWAATEVFEMGDGSWKKGSTIEYGCEKSKGDLQSMGWGKKKGKEMPPVWIVVHKV